MHYDANKMKSHPHALYHMLHFQIFDKIASFLKNVSNVLDSKKVQLRLG